jgi:1-acyl-sn-glycerol-3-phosphate acyltransferase
VRHLLSRLRGYFIFNPLIWFYTVVLGTASLISSLFDRDGHIQHGFARLWSWLILKTILSPLTVTGLEKIDTNKPHLYAVNHLSAMDIPALYVGLPFQFHILAKKSLFRYPFLGWHLRRSGQIPVDAESALASMRSLNRAAESLRSGIPLVIFPEGGRSRDRHLQPFMPGGFYVAIKAGIDIVPMALVGTFDLLPMNTYHIKPQPLQLLVGEPISTKGYTSRQVDQLSAVVHKAIEDIYYSKAEMEPRAPVPQPQAAG